MRFSASRLNTWMECELQAKYRYEDNIVVEMKNAKAIFGSVMHLALEHFYANFGDYDGAVDLFKRAWAQPSAYGFSDPVYTNRLNYNGLREKGLESLYFLKNQFKDADFTVIGTEIPFLIPFGRHELTGRIDLLGIQRSGTGAELLKIIDHKVNTVEPTETLRFLNIQFTTYWIAVNTREFWVGAHGEHDFPGLPNGEWLWETIGRDIKKRCVWHALWTHRELDAGQRTPQDIIRLARICDEIERAIELDVHVPHVGQPCAWCDYTDICSMDVPVTIAASQDTDDRDRWL